AITIRTTTQNVNLGRKGNPNAFASWSVDIGFTCLVGFTGFSDSYLNSLKVQYVQFKSCVWKRPTHSQVGSGVRTLIPIHTLKGSEHHHQHDDHHHDLGKTLLQKDIPDDPEETVEIMRVVESFLVANFSKIVELQKQKGGWGNWLQCELTFCLRTAKGYGSMVVLREFQAWEGSKQRADIVIYNVKETKPIVLELKTEGEPRPRNYVYEGVQTDIEKFAYGTLIG
ncbi:hypothetical protein LTR49_028900, partial [Elasticomyces elasticus]